MKRLLTYILFLLPLTLWGQILTPIHWTATVGDTTDSTVSVVLTATIDEGWHLYTQELPDGGPVPTHFAYNQPVVGTTTTDAPVHSDYDDNFEMELTYYVDRAVFTQVLLARSADELTGSVTFMACNDQMCLAPDTWEFSLNAASTNSSTETSSGQEVSSTETLSSSTESPDQESATTNAQQQSLLWIFLMGLLAGLLAVFTPCVWPIIPMTVSFFLKRAGAAKGQTAKAGIRDAVLYGVAIVIIYVGLGLLITAIFGASALNALSTNAVVNLIFFAILVVFAASFFGAFELTLPSSWSSKMDSKASSTGGFLSILFMAFTLVIVSFSCTGPIIGTLLVEAAGKSFLAPTVGMLGFAVALALPFTLFALFPGVLNRLPKSGGWMNRFKVTLAFLELALSLKFFSVADLAYGWHLLDREVFIALWVVIFTLLGLYLLGVFAFPQDDDSQRTTSVPRLFLAILSLAFAVYMIPGLWGAPLRAISAFAPPISTQDWVLSEGGAAPVHAHAARFDDMDEGLAYAKAHNMPVFLDFNGYGCVNCRKMEAAVLSKPQVAERLSRYVIISLIVDDKTPLDRPIEVVENGTRRTLKTVGDKWSYLQRTEYGANAQPYYLQLSPDGKRLTDSYVYDENIHKFLDWLIY